MLTPLNIIFYAFAAVAVGSAVFVITTRNPVRSVLSLVITFFAMAGIWMTLRAEFLSLILLLVYVGAVMTLFLFVVMMLSITKESQTGGFVKYLPVGLIVILLLTGLLIVSVGPSYFGLTQMPAPAPEAPDFSNISAIGTLLFTQYAYPFEMAGVVLLAAMIAAIALAFRGPLKRKIQYPAEQVDVSPAERLRLIDLRTEKKQGA